MTVLERLGPAELRRVTVAYRDALRAHQAAINRLNVYPVPDGDTGTNMALTLESVIGELDNAPADMGATCKAIGHGSLMGARGNSGVILSQILRGLSEALAGDEAADARSLAAGLVAGAAAAQDAVMRPVEGTILTVAREAAAEADRLAGEGAALVEVLEATREAAADSLARTPELLAVLAEAGVVDAGGAGYCLLFDALLHVADGRPLPAPPAEDEMATPDLDALAAAAHAGDDHDVGDLRYEVMYFLEAPDETIPAFKKVWAGVGDSIVVVGGDGVWNCHIHTDDIGAAVEAALDCGRPRQIRVTDLAEQVDEERWVREAAAGDADDDEGGGGEAVTTAVVAVATGEGIRRIFRSLGVQCIVAGGQSMNPSTAQILEVVEAAPADQVVILPNNKNIVPVAEQVDTQTDKRVRVVPTRGIAAGFAALMAYDPEADVDANAAGMAEAAEHVVAGEVTQAVRPSACAIGPIAEGDWLGVTRSGICAVEPSPAEATTRLLESLLGDDHEIVTLIEGQGATAGDTRRVTEWLAEHRPDLSCEVHHGGQPIYAYYVGIE